jgi:integrase
MIKYLAKKNNTFWYRRKIDKFGEILLSLKTKNYDIAILRHSYIDYKIKELIYKGAFKNMTIQEIRKLIDKYKNYMLNEEYNDFEELRDNELEIEIKGVKYGGHTKQALEYAINRYQNIHKENNLDLVKKETNRILNRSNLTNEDLSLLQTDKEKMIFHWELLKAEWEILKNAYDSQNEVVQEVTQEISPELLNKIYDYQNFYQTQEVMKKSNSMTISELLQKYIQENQAAKDWSDKNSRDLEYVLGHLSSFYNDKYINELTRENFSLFRDNVIRNLPKTSQNKDFIGKSTIEIIKIVKNKNLDKIAITTINKHLRRVHQVFEWASNCGYIEKNLTKDLKVKDKKQSTKNKNKKIPYTNEELIKLFHDSPWYNQDILQTLRYEPQNIFIPLLILYTGAKPFELGTLKINSIKKKNGIWGIDFNEMVKNTSSERFTPLAQTLIDLGFLKYVSYQKKQKETMLFPAIKIYKGGGINFTNEYTIYNRKYITNDENKTFYSFRHLVNQKLKNKKTRVYIVNDILGHSDGEGNKDIEVYGDSYMPEEILRDTINECLVYDFLDFSKIKEAIETIYQ